MAKVTAVVRALQAISEKNRVSWKRAISRKQALLAVMGGVNVAPSQVQVRMVHPLRVVARVVAVHQLAAVEILRREMSHEAEYKVSFRLGLK